MIRQGKSPQWQAGYKAGLQGMTWETCPIPYSQRQRRSYWISGHNIGFAEYTRDRSGSRYINPTGKIPEEDTDANGRADL